MEDRGQYFIPPPTYCNLFRGYQKALGGYGDIPAVFAGSAISEDFAHRSYQLLLLSLPLIYRGGQASHLDLYLSRLKRKLEQETGFDSNRIPQHIWNISGHRR
jgi:hypothetical protein